ncbi:MAG: lipopolysaccharide biosynthesis protein [Bacteroidales bacterium]|nr:lipopolysaccharide biosynthesis protein [Bacteroidales bacterium]
MSFRKSLFKNIIVLGGYSYTTQFIGFLATIILSRLLVPSEYGFVALITVFTGFINQFSNAGLSYIIIRSDYNHLFQSTIHYLSVVIGVLLAFIMVLLAYPISLFYQNPLLVLPTIIMSSNFVLRSFNTIPFGVLSKDLKFNILGKIELICAVTEVVLMITLAFLKFSYWSLIIPSILGNILRIILYNTKSGIRFKLLKSKYLVVGFRKAKSIIGNITAINLLNYWAVNADNLIIGKVFGNQSLGLYDRAYKMLNLANSVISNLFGKVLYPSLKKLSNEGGDVNKEYMNTLGIISLMNFPVSVLLIFFSEPLVRILWSERWIQVAELLPYVGILILVQTLNNTTGNIFILKGKEKMMMWLGIPVNTIIIGAIAVGALFSMVHVLRFYALSSVALDIPLVAYFGFKKAFGFENKVIIKFWLPKIILSVILIITIWLNLTWLTIIFVFLYFVHLAIDQKEDIFNLFRMFRIKIREKRN